MWTDKQVDSDPQLRQLGIKECIIDICHLDIEGMRKDYQ
jgi:hypothetical protein